MGPLRTPSDLSPRSQNLIDLSSDFVLALWHTSNRQVVDSYLPDSTLGPSSTSGLLQSTFVTVSNDGSDKAHELPPCLSGDRGKTGRSGGRGATQANKGPRRGLWHMSEVVGHGLVTV